MLLLQCRRHGLLSTRAAQVIGGGYLPAFIDFGQLQQKLGLKNMVFGNVNCAFVTPGRPLRLKDFANGILGAGILSKCRVIVDYSRNRIAFIPASPEKSVKRPFGMQSEKPKEQIDSSELQGLIFFCLALSVALISLIIRALGLPGFE